MTSFDWIICEACLVLCLQATEIKRRWRFYRCLFLAGVRTFASSVLAWLSLVALAFTFFSGSDVGLTANCIDVYFYWAWFPCKVVVFTRHSVTAILAHIENWNTVLFMAKSSQTRRPISIGFRHVREQIVSSCCRVYWVIWCARTQPRREWLSFNVLVSGSQRIVSIALVRVLDDLLSIKCIKIVRRSSVQAQSKRIIHRLRKFAVILSEIEPIFGFLDCPIHLSKMRRQSLVLDVFDRSLELHLNLLDALWLLFSFSHEVKVVNVLRVEGFDPLRDDQTLLQKLHFLVCTIVLSISAHVTINLQFCCD